MIINQDYDDDDLPYPPYSRLKARPSHQVQLRFDKLRTKNDKNLEDHDDDGHGHVK